MRAIMRSALFVVVLLLASIGTTGAASGVVGVSAKSSIEDSFISFEEFYAQIRNASYEVYAHRSGAQVESMDAFNAMRSYILQHYEGVKVVSSFVDDQTHYVDCITTETQPSVRGLALQTIATPPLPSNGDRQQAGKAPSENQGLADSHLDHGLKDPYGHELSCAKGAVPIQRLTLENMVLFANLHAFLAKSPDEVLPDRGEEIPADNSIHHYAKGDDSVVNYGGNSWLNLWTPAKGFSLSQQWYVGGTGKSKQTVEGGWVYYPSKFKDKSVIFIYWTADGYDKTGCYNLECKAFVQTNSHWYLGGTFDHYSTTGGQQWGFEQQWRLYKGNWWLYIKGPSAYEAVGYYPASIYNGGQLIRNAQRASFGGEVASKASPFPPMGSGAFANQGWQKAAFQKTVFTIPREESGGTGVWANLSKYESAPKCYTINITPASRGGSWGTSFYFGGPGGTCP